ncbi:MAG: alpha/beta hydrolase [Planctomycetota bacterium]
MKNLLANKVLAWVFLGSCLFGSAVAQAQDEQEEKSKFLPGKTSLKAGESRLEPFAIEGDLKILKGVIAVPENRRSSTSRNIKLYFYQIKSPNPSGLAPVVFLPGGPGGFYNDDWIKGMPNTNRRSGSIFEAQQFLKNRDVVLVNQRGARFPDRSFWMFYFMSPGGSARRTRTNADYADAIRKGFQGAVKHWTQQGMDLSGYDIANMVEDINDVRKSLDYEKVVLRGNSFGSQWSLAFIRQYPHHVDRAILGGVEPLDYGYDSHEGVWNVFTRLSAEVDTARDAGFQCPDVSLTEAIKEIVNRLEEKTVDVELEQDDGRTKTIPVGADDFRNLLRAGIRGKQPLRKNLQVLPKFIYEVYEKDYRFLALRGAEARSRPVGGSMQSVLIDNSLGISDARDQRLTQEPARKWLGELNLIYKATRDDSPTPVISDEFRKLNSDVPILMIQGDYDLKTPFENAEELLSDVSYGHLIRVHGGTHSAVDEVKRHDDQFMSKIELFLNSDLSDAEKIKSLYSKLPKKYHLPKLEFESMDRPLYVELKDK